MSNAASDLLTRLLLDQSSRWRRGQPLAVEGYLEQHPSLNDDPEQVLDLISNEIYLRSVRKEEPRLDEYRRRFPHLAEQIALQFELHQAAGSAMGSNGPPRSPTAAEKEPPPVIPGYEAIGELGRGSMGIVYKARQLSLRRVVALKVLRAGGKNGAILRARFRIEAEAVARLQHPNIVQIFEVGEHEDFSYIALELVEGGSLAGRLHGEPMSERDAAQLVETLARAMHYAHQRGVLHRDLKPGNVLLGAELGAGSAERPDSAGLRAPSSEFRVPKITDFGLAKRLGGPTRLTRLGDVLGTPSYMAPEQAHGDPRQVGVPADVYSLGAILYELLTGRPPFKEESALETLLLVDSAEPAAPTTLRRGLSQDLEAVCLKCLAKQPEKRYATASELAEELGRFLAGGPVMARPIGVGARMMKWIRRAPAQAALVAGCVLAACLLVAGGLFHGARLQEERSRALRQQQQTAEQLLALRVERDDSVKGRGSARQPVTALTKPPGAAMSEQDVRWRLLRARRELYERQLGSAVTAWREDPGRARQLLDDTSLCPFDLRDLTWTALSRACNQHRRVLRGHTANVIAVAASHETLVSVGIDGTGRLWNVATGRESRVLNGHMGRVYAVAFGGRGKLLATAGADRTVRLWDAAGKLIHTLTGHRTPVFAVAFVTGGRVLASAGEDGEIHLWNTETGKEKAVLAPFRSAIHGLAFSPDGKILAAVGEDGVVKLWDMDGQKLHGLLLGHTQLIYAVAFSGDGKTLATAGADGTVRFWDPTTGATRCILSGHMGRVCTVAFSPDGQTLASGADGGEIRLWDVNTGQHLRTIPVGSSVFGLAFLADGKSLAFSAGPTVEIRPMARSALTAALDGRSDDPRTLPAHAYPLRALAVSGDGRVLLTAAGGTTPPPQSAPSAVILWDTATGMEKAVVAGHPGPVRCVEFSPDGRLGASGGSGGEVKVWDGRTGKAKSDPTPRHEGPVLALAFGPGGKLLASAGLDGTIHLHPTDSDGDGAVLRGHLGPVLAVAVSPDGKTVASGGGDGTVRLWDAASGKEKTVLHGHVGPVLALAFDPKAKTLASGAGSADGMHWSRIGEIITWDLAAGKSTAVIPAHSLPVAALAYAADGKTLLSISTRGPTQNGEIKAWEVPAGKEWATYPWPKDAVVTGALTSSGRLLMLADQGKGPFVWDAASSKILSTIKVRNGSIAAAAFSPDGKTAATVIVPPPGEPGYAGEARVWDLATGEPLFTLRDPTAEIVAAALSHDGTTAATGTTAGVVRLWNPHTGKESFVIQASDGAVEAAAFSADGHQLATVGSDRLIKLWDTVTGKLLSAQPGPRLPVRALAFGPDGLLAAAAGEAGVKIWEATAGKDRPVLGDHHGAVRVMGFSNDGRQLTMATHDGRLRTFDVANGKEVAVVPLRSEGITCLASQANGTVVITGGTDRTVRWWRK